MKPCPGSAGGHPHGHVYYISKLSKKRERRCHYCDQPCAPEQTGVTQDPEKVGGT